MARLDDRIGWIHVDEVLADNDPLFVLLCCQFDEQCDQDEIAIKEMILIEKKDRKLALIRCMSFPIDFLGQLLFFGTKMAMRRWDLQKKLALFVLKKITHQELAKAVRSFG